MALVLDAAVEAGVTIHELSQDVVRAGLLRRAGVGMLSEPQWLQVRDRLVRAAVREAGGSKSCELCAAPVMWVATTGGSRMPVDPLPTLAGNVLVTQDPRSHRRRAKVLTKAELDDDPWPRYRSHFATCPREAEVARRPVASLAQRRARKAASRPPVVAVEVRLEVLAATESMVSRLRKVLEEHPGRVPVRVVLTQPGREVVLSCPIKVEPGDPLAADLKVLLGGHDTMRYVYAEESL